MQRIWTYLKWLGAALGAIGFAVAAFVYGKQTQAVRDARVKEKEAKLRRVQLEVDLARNDAERAESEEAAARHIERAETMELRIVDLKTDMHELTGDLSEAAAKLDDDDYAEESNRRRHANGSAARSDSVG